MAYVKLLFLICLFALIVLFAWVISAPDIIPVVEYFTATPMPPTATPTPTQKTVLFGTPVPNSAFWSTAPEQNVEGPKSSGRGSKDSEVADVDDEDGRNPSTIEKKATPSDAQRP